LKARRHVDWSHLPASEQPQARIPERGASSEFASWLSILDELLASEEPDAIVRSAVEMARERIGLVRVSVFLRDDARHLMQGTWGTDLQGATVDEHLITFDIPSGDQELYDRAARSGVHWTVVDNAPLVVHLPTESREVGVGWVCCTPIRGASEMLGMMYNDAGLTGAPIDEAKQARVALLCSLVGTALAQARRGGYAWNTSANPARSPVVVKALRLLSQDPDLSSEQLGAQLRLSASRISRVFKSEMGMSLVEYRNRLRLERFSKLLDERGDNLLEAALAAGFGSYSHFHRVFLALRGTTPGKFLRSGARHNPK
jgi:AraC-like DNA-binding protein